MHPKTRYKFCECCKNRARDTPLQGVYIPHFGQILVKASVVGVLYPYLCTDGGEIWHGVGDRSSVPNVNPIGANANTAFRMKIIIIGRFSLTISATLAVILDSEKATLVASGHPG